MAICMMPETKHRAIARRTNSASLGGSRLVTAVLMRMAVVATGPTETLVEEASMA